MAIELTPASIGGGGDIPAGYDQVNFTLRDANWTARVTLPAASSPGAQISISNTAQATTEVMLDKTDLPVPSVTLASGETLRFTYGADSQRWIYQSQYGTQSPNAVGAQVQTHAGEKIARYVMWDGNWTSSVHLPATAADGALAMVQSSATWGSLVDPTNLQYASSTGIQSGDAYVLRYTEALKRWVLIYATARTITAQNAGTPWALPTPQAALSVFNLANGAWRPEVILPPTAGDRDRIRLTSQASWPVSISNLNAQYQGSMVLGASQTYEFIFIKEKALWVLQSAPVPEYVAVALPTTQATPSMVYRAYDGAWAPQVVLPAAAKPGDQVVVNSTASWGFDVNAGGVTLDHINAGDIVRYVYGPSGWTRGTTQVTMLLVYGDSAANRFGDSAMRLRLAEGLRLTNEALENSGANFYVKAVGYLRHELPGTTLQDVVDVGRTDSVVQNQRDLLRADAVYYEGTQNDICGRAWPAADQFNMIAAGSISCGTTTMRHEFGHNMGLEHCWGGVYPYAHGNALTGDIMCGNAIPYYSTPARYTRDGGLPLGQADVIDSVRAMNERSASVAAYR